MCVGRKGINFKDINKSIAALGASKIFLRKFSLNAGNFTSPMQLYQRLFNITANYRKKYRAGFVRLVCGGFYLGAARSGDIIYIIADKMSVGFRAAAFCPIIYIMLNRKTATPRLV